VTRSDATERTTAALRRARRPSAAIASAVFAGSCVGGLARYGVTRAWPTPTGGFPWATFVVNLSGAFVLALLLVAVNEVLRPTTYVRPLLATGFCGAWTTFSSIVAATDQLVAHGHAVTGTLYLVGSAGGGLTAAAAGLVSGRLLAQRRDGSA
jgi:CrcB protein